MTVRVSITVERAARLMREVIGDFGDGHVYTSPNPRFRACKYAHEDGPGCLVGQVLYRAGVSLDELAAMDDDESGTYILSCRLPEGVRITAEARVFLQVAQNWQDRGQQWGTAYDEAMAGVTLNSLTPRKAFPVAI